MEIKYRNDLYKLLPPKPVVAELGCAEGLFSRDMLNWGLTELIMVDMWESHPEFPGDAGSPQEWHTSNFEAAMERVKGFPVKVLRGPTVAMAQAVASESVDLVYVDACHSYECVSSDILAWWDNLKKGGIMAFHDYKNKAYGVKEAVIDFCRMPAGPKFWLDIHNIPENKPEDAGAWIRKP